ncbi:pogo transposable element with KRAB domain [Fragilaria crotonensis]|nr:pogo transposable element with KRAB domain [Fragilaria crotonensis]
MTTPKGVIPILFLDLYGANMMTSIIEQITALGVDVEHIPGGCTGLSPPVDIAVNKPFKHEQICQQWEDWMIDIGLQGAPTCPPSTEDIVKWTLQAKNEIPRQIIINS